MVNLLEKAAIKGSFIYAAASGIVTTSAEGPSLGTVLLLIISSFVFAYGIYSLRKDLLNYFRGRNGGV